MINTLVFEYMCWHPGNNHLPVFIYTVLCLTILVITVMGSDTLRAVY